MSSQEKYWLGRSFSSNGGTLQRYVDCEKIEYCNFSKGSTLHTSEARKFRAVG
jgi:hypothetical protein